MSSRGLRPVAAAFRRKHHRRHHGRRQQERKLIAVTPGRARSLRPVPSGRTEVPVGALPSPSVSLLFCCRFARKPSPGRIRSGGRFGISGFSQLFKLGDGLFRPSEGSNMRPKLNRARRKAGRLSTLRRYSSAAPARSRWRSRISPRSLCACACCGLTAMAFRYASAAFVPLLLHAEQDAAGCNWPHRDLLRARPTAR